MNKSFIQSAVNALILFTVFFYISGCSGGNTQAYSDDAGVPAADGIESVNGLEDYNGWWRRPDDYVSEGISVLNFFRIDAGSETWTVYNRYGFAGYTYNCRNEGDLLILELDFVDEYPFLYNGTALLNEEGGVEFIRGEPLESNPAELDGKWLLSGEQDSGYYLIENGAYKLIKPYMEEPSETGTWKYNDVTVLLENGTVQEKQIEFIPDDEENFWGGGDFIPEPEGIAFFDSFNKVFYIRESAMGTPDGCYAEKKLRLICSEWKGPEFTSPVLYFSHYGTFDITVFDEQGSGERSEAGKWSYDGGKILLEFYDGSVEEAEYGDDGITVGYYGMTFERRYW